MLPTTPKPTPVTPVRLRCGLPRRRSAWFSFWSLDHITRMTKLGIIIVAASILFCGCVSKSFDSSERGTWELHIVADKPQQYVVRVPTVGDYSVSADGRVQVLIFRTTHRWEYDLLGESPVMWHETTSVPYIYVVNGEHIASRIYTPTMYKLPIDSDGYIVVKVK